MVNLAQALSGPTTVTVAPTETVMLQVSREALRSLSYLIVEVTNSDGAQTLACTVYGKKTGMAWAASDFPFFESIAAGVSVMAAIDLRGFDEVELRGSMSGAGGDAVVGANKVNAV